MGNLEKKKLKIDVLCSPESGSPIGVTEQTAYGIDGRIGVGGAELGILTLCRLWHDAGHDVTFYNSGQNGHSEFKHANHHNFSPHADRDILIIFRSPDQRVLHAKGKKIWYSNDQFTTGDFASFSKMVDKIVVISEFHQEFFKKHYNILNTTVIDIPVRTWDYDRYKDIPKIKNSCIFTSVPDRGLLELAPIWDRIVEQMPDATLTITSDWALWNGRDFSNEVLPYRLAFAKKHRRNTVKYLSAVKREELVKIQAEAEFHLYPCVYDELYCISVAESQVAGAIPITSTTGAVNTTNRFGYKIFGNPKSAEFISNFADSVISLMKSPVMEDIKSKARKEFGAERILAEWDKIFYE